MSKSSSVTFEDYDPEVVKRANYLKNQLAIVDKAIEKVLNGHDDISDNNISEASSLTSGRVIQGRIPTSRETSTILKSSSLAILDTDGDKSFRIDTVATQLATCPHCSAEMDTKKLKVHISSQCPNKVIICPELNCGCSMNLRQLRKHLDKECVVAKQRRGLIESAKIRKELELEEQRKAREAEMLRIAEARKRAAEMPPHPSTPPSMGAGSMALISEPDLPQVVMCPQCNESIKNSQLVHHLKEKCSMRRIMCPNIHAGCDQLLIPLKLLQHHLQHDCRAEKLRDMMIERAKERHEPIQCTACGEWVPIMYMRKHDLERCVNRRVPCRNKGLGCQVMVRLLEREMHEYVDGKRQMRNALYFNGHGSVIDIAEDDIPCPWTAEYWLYRPSLMESAKSHIRNILLQIPDYNLRYVAEICIKNQVQHIVDTLKAPPDTSLVQAKGVSKEEKSRLAKAQAQERLDLVNSLTAMVYVYNDMVLSYMKAFQKLAISIEAGIHCVEEIIRTVAFPGSKLVSNLRPIYPGVSPKSTPKPAKPPKQVSTVNTTAAPSEGDPTADPSTANSSRPQSASTVHTNASSMGEETYHSQMDEDQNLEDGSQGEIMQDGEESHDGDDGSVKDGAELPSAETGEAAALVTAEVATEGNDPEDIERMLAELDEVSEEEMAEEMARMKKREDDRIAAERAAQKALDQVKKIHLEAANAYMEGGNAFAYLYKKGFELQNKQLFDVVQERISQLSIQEESNGSPEVNAENFNHELDHILSLLELQKAGVTNFLMNSMCFPKIAMSDKLEWSGWLSLLMAWKNCLIHDLNTLQTFRINAGLIKPEEGGSKKKKHLTAEQEKAIANKEKARKKKEMKKKAQMEEQHAVEGNTDDEHSVSSVAAGGYKKNAKQQQQNETESNKHEKKVQDKLLPRLLELFKGNCGAEVLAESSSFSDENTYSKICLSLNSGLSLLGWQHTKGGENEDEEEDEEIADGTKTPATMASAASGGGGAVGDYHYNLLIKPYDLKKMVSFSDRVGIISAKKAAGSKVPSGNSIGTDAQSFDATIPRGKWSHVAIVATATPVNRVSLYLDGLFIKHLNNCSFPLPMSVLGGATTSFSTFEGALLDVRYWNKQRSNVEIMDSMHRLIDLSEPGVPKNSNAALNDDGLVAWWTFEDGVGGENRVTDVTAHRFKTPITKKPIISLSYPIPSEVVEILPKAFRWMVDEQPLPPRDDSAATATPLPSTSAVIAVTVTDEAAVEIRPRSSGNKAPSTLPTQVLLANIPNTRWLDAEAMPQGYKHVSAGTAPIASTGSSKSGKSGKVLKIGTPASKAAVAAGRRRPGESTEKPGAASSNSGSDAPVSVAKKPAAPNMFQDSGTLPVPSFRQRRLCPFEIRRFRLATSGRELQRETECPMGCNTKLRAIEVRFHVKFECVQRMTTCRFDYCEGVFRICEREEHEATDCAVLKSRNKILDGYTGNELSICPYCSEPIKNKFMTMHTTSKCVHRMVLCPNIGCSTKTVKAHRLDHHLKFECDSQVAVGRRILIEKARKRLNYARPWGLQIDVLPLTDADLPVTESIPPEDDGLLDGSEGEEEGDDDDGVEGKEELDEENDAEKKEDKREEIE